MAVITWHCREGRATIFDPERPSPAIFRGIPAAIHMTELSTLLQQLGPVGLAILVMAWMLKNGQSDRENFLTRLDKLNETMAESHKSFIAALATLQTSVDTLQKAQARLASSMDEMSKSLIKIEALNGKDA